MYYILYYIKKLKNKQKTKKHNSTFFFYEFHFDALLCTIIYVLYVTSYYNTITCTIHCNTNLLQYIGILLVSYYTLPQVVCSQSTKMADLGASRTAMPTTWHPMIALWGVYRVTDRRSSPV